MSTTQVVNLAQLPAEIVGMIAEEAAELGPYRRPYNLLAVSRLSQASKALRRDCLPPLLSYVRLKPVHAPSLLQWLHREPRIACLVRTIDLDPHAPCGDRMSAVSASWASEAASAIALEKACPTLPRGAHRLHLLGDLIVCILKCTWNFRAVVNAGFEFALREWTAGQLEGANLEFLQIGPADRPFVSKDLYSEADFCSVMHSLRLFKDGNALRSLKSLAIFEQCGGDACLSYLPQLESWLSHVGPTLAKFRLCVDDYVSELMTPAALTSMLDSMPSIREFRMDLYASFEGDHQAKIWSLLAQALVSATYLPSTLVSLHADISYDHSNSARESVGGIFLAHLTHFSCLKRLSITFPRVSDNDTDMIMSLPPALESLTFTDVGNEWSDWVCRHGGTFSMLPWATLSNAVQEGTVPSSLRSITLGLRLEQDYCDVVDPNGSFRWKVTAWTKELVSLFLETLKTLKESCGSRAIQIRVQDLFGHRVQDFFEGPMYTVDDLIDYLEDPEGLRADRKYHSRCRGWLSDDDDDVDEADED